MAKSKLMIEVAPAIKASDADSNQAAIDRFKDLAKTGKKEVKYKAILALSVLKQSAEFAVPLLIDMLVNGDNRQSATAAKALVAVGEPAIPEVLKLMERTADPDDADSGPDENAQLNGIAIITEILTLKADKEEAEKRRKQQEQVNAAAKKIIGEDAQSECCAHS